MSVSELSTVEYTVKKIVKATDENYKLLGIDTNIKKKGDRKILFTCTVYLKAGINLSKYDPSETVIDEINKNHYPVFTPRPTHLLQYAER
mgnify:CR=1 FL=1